MKLAEAVEQVKREKPHSFSMDHCTLFITEAEQAVQEYLGIPVSERRKYRWEEDGKKELIAPEPYSALYISYLKLLLLLIHCFPKPLFLLFLLLLMHFLPYFQ